jgi:hypothetical protein
MPKLFFGILLLICPVATALADSEILAVMNQMQTYTHKLLLSVDAGNNQLAGFYAHELEEQIEELEHIEEYDGHQVGKLAGQILTPVFKQLEASTKASNMAAASIQIDALISACNQCHQTTEHGYIVIKKNLQNNYLQDFAPQP